MCLRITFLSGMNFSQDTLIDAKRIFKQIPNLDAAKSFSGFDLFVMPFADMQKASNLLLRHTLLFAGFL